MFQCTFGGSGMRASSSIESSNYAHTSRVTQAFTPPATGLSNLSQTGNENTNLLFETLLVSPPQSPVRIRPAPAERAANDDDSSTELESNSQPETRESQTEQQHETSTSDLAVEVQGIQPDILTTTLSPTTDYVTDVPVQDVENFPTLILVDPSAESNDDLAVELQPVQIENLASQKTIESPLTLPTAAGETPADALELAAATQGQSVNLDAATGTEQEVAQAESVVNVSTNTDQDNEQQRQSTFQADPKQEQGIASVSADTPNESDQESGQQSPETFAQTEVATTEEADQPAKWFETPDAPQYGSTQSLAGLESSSGGAQANSQPLEASAVDHPGEASATAASDATNPTSVEKQPDETSLETPAHQTAPQTTAVAGPSIQNTASGTSDAGESNPSPSRSGNEAPTRPVSSASKPPTNAGGESAPQPDISQQERVRLIQRVARSFSRIGADGGQLQLRLHPPQLGSLAVRVQVEGGSLSAKLTAESEAAKEVILEGLPMLRKRLADQGVEITQFQVDVSSGTSDMFTSGNSEQHSQEFHDGQRDRRASTPLNPAANATAGEAETTNEPRRIITSYSIDVHA